MGPLQSKHVREVVVAAARANGRRPDINQEVSPAMSEPSIDTRRFPLGTILTVTTGRLLCPIGDLYQILDYMTGDQLFTHQLPRAADECKGPLLEQHPELSYIEVPQMSGEEQCLAWLAVQTLQYGDHLPVTPLADRDHTVIDPLVELEMMAPGKPVITVVLGDSEQNL